MPKHNKQDDDYALVLAELSHHIRLIDILEMLKHLQDDELQRRIDKQLRISRGSMKSLREYDR